MPVRTIDVRERVMARNDTVAAEVRALLLDARQIRTALER